MTDACSGVDHWAGAAREKTRQQQQQGSPVTSFKCPQQDLYLPPSRIHDGICDCCCGSDERHIGGVQKVVCEDVCEEVLREERMQREKLAKNYELGSRERNQRLEEFQSIVHETFGQISQLEQEVKPLERFIRDTSEIVQRKQQELVGQYLDNARERTQDILQQQDGTTSGFFQRLVDRNWDEKVEFLAAICQWYGEMILASGSQHGRHRDAICEPLKLAALDAGLLWDGSTVQVPTGWGEELVLPLLSRIGYTSQQQMEKEEEEEEWTDPEDEILDEEYHGYDDDDVMAAGMDDDDYHVDETKKDRHHEEETSQLNDSKEQEIQYSNDFQCIFGKIMRSNFHQQAKEITSMLDSTMKSQESSEENAHENDEDKEDDKEEEHTSSPLVDPMAIQMVRNTLSSRIGQVEHGNALAKSAMAMMKSLQQDNPDINDWNNNNNNNSRMNTLLVNAINYSRISEVDAEEILAVITTTTNNFSSDTCFSPYMVMCDDAAPTLKQSIAQRCTERKDATFCVARSPDDSSSSDPMTIPSHVPNGFLNYYLPKARGDDDYFTKVFETHNLVNSLTDSNIPQLDQEIQKTKKDVETIKNQIKQKRDDLGLDENSGRTNNHNPKYGTNGELYALRDQCFSITSGKYNYEVCLFGRAYQREGSAKAGGTHLGNWNGSSVDDTTGTRVLKWKGGAKCWNGPNRSATVYVTCGSETKLLSADEPNICEYEFQMESYIACDNRYKLAHKL